jgi:lichenan operon transcriptional antiterminator
MIASKLNVSERTVRNDIKQLEQMLEGCAVIEGVQGKYSLRVFDQKQFQDIFEELTQEDKFLNSPRNRMDYLFGKLMRATLPVLTDDLAYEMSVGRTTLVGDLKKLRTELEEYHISIVGKTSKGLMLCGDELDIRKYVLETSYDQLYRDYPLDEEIEAIIGRHFQQNQLDKKVETEFRQFIILMLDRFLTGHYIGTLSGRYYNLTATPEFEIVSALIDEIGAVLQTEFPAEEKLFTLLPIIGMRTPADIKGIRSIELDEQVRPLLQKILEQIQVATTLSIELGEFQEEFLYHLMFMLNRLRFHVHIENPMIEDLVEKYPLAYQVAGIAARVIERECGFAVPVDERGYLASYFGVFLAESQLRMEKQCRAAVVCGTGKVNARLVEVQLKKVLDSSTQIIQLAAETVTPEQLNDFDIIFTTTYLGFECDRPVIQINEIFNEQELRRKIDKARYWSQTSIPVLDNNWFVMTGLLDESRFFVLDKAANYDEGIAEMVLSLTAQGQLDEGFLDRLVEREKKGTMAFDHSIALPHSVQYANDQLLLAIGVFPEPKIHKGHEISVIFLLALPEHIGEGDNLLIRIYDEIISISQDEELLHKIASAGSYIDLLRVLYRQAE